MHERIDDWRAFLGTGLADDERDAIRAGERTGRPIGSEAFAEQVGRVLGRDVRPAPPR